MANYINSPILFESYVHIDAHYQAADDAFESLKQEIHSYLQERAEHFLYDDVTSEVRFKEGSLKAYATVRGSLSKCLGIAYDDFSQEIDRLYWFAKRLSDAAVMEVTFRSGSFLRAIERTEARPGIVGTTKRLVDKFLSIRAVEGEKAAAIIIRRLRNLRLEVDHLFQLLGYEDDVVLVRREFRNLLKLAPAKLGTRPLSAETEERYKNEKLKLVTFLNS